MQLDTALDIELDLPPEYCHYRDEGCELGESCLNCRLPICIYDEPRGRQRWLKKERNREIVRLYGEGKSTHDLAKMFHVSQRTIQRALRKPAEKTLPHQKETEEQDERGL